MKLRVLNRNFLVVLAGDTLLLAAAWYAAHLLRFNFDIPEDYLSLLVKALPYVVVAKLLVFFFFDLYRGMWRYTSIADLINVIKAAITSSLLVICLVLFWTRFGGFSRSVFLIDLCLTVLLIAGFRLSIRLYLELLSDETPWATAAQILFQTFRKNRPDCKDLLIIGAGDCGEKIYRELRDNARLRYNVVGYLDDDPAKINRKIHGIPVLGRISDIKMVAQRLGAQESLIAIPSATAQQMRRVVSLCEESGINFKTIPGMGELIDGRLTVSTIRNVTFQDLLGREVVHLDEQRIGAYLFGKKVLVTGAGGSIGSELCRQICRFQPEMLVLYERSESPLYELEMELRQKFSKIKLVSLLADIQDLDQLRNAFELTRPQAVFHAAAYKHVPVLELQPWKAIKNNILGTRNVVDIANLFKVERFVFVSTDKAVNPTNVMGASKRIAELLIQGQNNCGRSTTRYMTVRFGNVVGSAGSVVPLFKRQIEKGGPVTVTHKDATRYFMTIPEACQLILQAGAMGEGGEIFILDMGTPVKIDDMARDLIRLSGFEPDLDIRIHYIGLRPGEKLTEELITQGEGIIPTSHEKILVLRGAQCSADLLRGRIEELAVLSNSQDSNKIKEAFRSIIPEYEPYQEDRPSLGVVTK